MTRPRIALFLLMGALMLPGCSHDTKQTQAGASRAVPAAPPPGKLETIERGRYPLPAREGDTDAAAAPAAEGAENDIFRIEGESSGSPGLVLTRAMSGSQAMGYTLIELDERDLFFVAEKRSSLLGTVLGGTTGTCRMVIGAQKDPATGAVKVTLKGRSATPTGRAACERDLRKVLAYARGDEIVKPKKPSPFSRPGDVYRHEP